MSRKKIIKNEIVADKDGIRFATPEPVARYRAERLKCNVIADISCGIGGQALYFALKCDLVYAIEIDPKKIAYAKKNAKKMGVENIIFLTGNSLSTEITEQLPDIDIVFSDPARPPSEKERNIENMSPSIPEVIRTYAGKCSNFAFEAPPQLTPEKIPFDCEKEYMSLEGKLNRLNLYFGEIKKADVSAVALPGNNIIRKQKTQTDAPLKEKTGLYAYEPEECVTKAGLLGQLTSHLLKDDPDAGIFDIDGKRVLISSEKRLECSLFKNRYRVAKIMKPDIGEINLYLRQNSFGTVIIRAAVDPDKYWDVRNNLEHGLKGERKAHLFIKDNDAIICEVLDY